MNSRQSFRGEFALSGQGLSTATAPLRFKTGLTAEMDMMSERLWTKSFTKTSCATKTRLAETRQKAFNSHNKVFIGLKPQRQWYFVPII